MSYCLRRLTWSFFLVLFMTGLAHAEDEASGQDSPIAEARQDMIETLYQYEFTGDPNYDYANLMIPLNRAAIEMSRQVLDRSDDDQLLRVVEPGLSARQEENESLQGWLDRYQEPNPGNDAEALTETFQNVRNQIRDGREVLEPTGDLESDFAQAMIWHHEVAIALSQTFMQNSTDAQLRLFANDVKRVQTRELAELGNWEQMR